MRCGGTTSDLFPFVTGVCQWCVLATALLSGSMDWILGRMSERSSCGASFGNVKISDLDFTDDIVICDRLSMTSWMLLSCLYLFVVRMLRSRRDSLSLAVIFMCMLAVS